MSAPVAVPLVKFNAGEVSPRVRGRSDLDWYAASSEIQLNAISIPQGPATMRPGTFYVGRPRATAVRFIPFVASVDPLEAYMLELTAAKMRFWYAGTRTQVMAGPSSPFELDTPWAAGDLATIRVVQSRDVMWMAHGSHRTRKLKRLTVDTFSIEDVAFEDGPYYPQIPLDPTTPGPALITAGVEYPAGPPGTATTLESSEEDMWTADDVGRLWRLGAPDGSDAWGYVEITGFTDARNVAAVVKSYLPAGSATGTRAWRAGLWSDRTGWPRCAVFHQERLCYGSNPAGSFPRIDGSRQGAFDTFKPGTEDDDAVSYVLASSELPVVRDLVSDRALIALMSSQENRVGSERSTEAITPSNVPPVTKISKEGALDTPAIAAKENTIFINRYARSVHEIAYSVDAEGLRTRELSIRADHIGDRQPFAGATWQNKPHNLIWLWGEIGLAAMTYTPEQTVLAMHRHRLGGKYLGEAPRVVTMASVPGERSDEVWLAVWRTIGGVTGVYIDVLADTLHDSEPQDEAVYLDSAVRARGEAPAATLTISDVTETEVTLTADTAVFAAESLGSHIKAVLADLDEDADDGQLQWRRLDLEITEVVSTTVAKASRVAAWLPSSMLLVTGYWRGGISSIDLPHLIGEEVKVLADGEDLGRFTVPSGGTITLAERYITLTAGLPYRMIVQPNLMDAGARQGTARTRLQRAHALGIELVRSGPFSVGVPGNVFEQPLRTTDDLLDEAVPLYTGTYLCELPSGLDERRTRWRVEAEGPLPVTLATAIPQQAIGEAVP